MEMAPEGRKRGIISFHEAHGAGMVSEEITYTTTVQQDICLCLCLSRRARERTWEIGMYRYPCANSHPFDRFNG